jgi:hypothetical protein
MHEPLRRRIRVALALAGAVTFAVYVLLAERAAGRRDPISLTTFGLVFASVFWAVVAPWWTFPGRDRPRLARRGALACTARGRGGRLHRHRPGPNCALSELLGRSEESRSPFWGMALSGRICSLPECSRTDMFFLLSVQFLLLFH